MTVYYQPSLFPDLPDGRRDFRDLPHGMGWIVFALTPGHQWEIDFCEQVPVGRPGGLLGAEMLNWRSASLHTFKLVQRRYVRERVEGTNVYKPSTRLLLDMYGEAIHHFGQWNRNTRLVRADAEWYMTGFQQQWPGHPDVRPAA